MFFRKKKSAEENNKPTNNLLAKLGQSLVKTKSNFGQIFSSKKKLDTETLDEIETILLTADVGSKVTNKIIADLKGKLTSDDWLIALKEQLRDLLIPVAKPLLIENQNPYVILVIGVNGAGKTTSIGKLAYVLKQQGKKVMLAAGDTFRAAAVEQLQQWGIKNDISVIAQHTGADSASVIFDALTAAKARGVDVLIADTAGRLHTKGNLMIELKKVRKVIGKIDDKAPHEVLLVLDATTGQNALNQVAQFQENIGVTGLALTKLDGTAKGGIIFALAERFNLPIRFIGIGEQITDLREFNAEEFVNALID